MAPKKMISKNLDPSEDLKNSQFYVIVCGHKYPGF